MRRPLAVLYLLASSYLVARLLVNRLVTSRWGLDAELAACVLAVPLAQLPVVLLASPLLRRRKEGP